MYVAGDRKDTMSCGNGICVGNIIAINLYSLSQCIQSLMGIKCFPAARKVMVQMMEIHNFLGNIREALTNLHENPNNTAIGRT